MVEGLYKGRKKHATRFSRGEVTRKERKKAERKEERKGRKECRLLIFG